MSLLRRAPAARVCQENAGSDASGYCKTQRGQALRVFVIDANDPADNGTQNE
jgi:hypothetical protein